ncbi:MAG: PaaI family thioesterase [Anaerolineae bacterium]|nr:PaaI family thioesterase [Anaerolineae bacterium]
MQPELIPNHWPGKCFGCSPRNEHGLKLQFWRTSQGVYSLTRIPAEKCGFDGLAHGGIIALLFDEIGQWTLLGKLGAMGMTHQLKVRYHRAVHTERQIRLEGRILSVEDKLASIEARILDPDDGAVLAEAESQWILASTATIARVAGADERMLQEFLDAYQ